MKRSALRAAVICWVSLEAPAFKRDTSFLGRFTLDTLLDFEGMARILTILARGFLFHHPDGSLADDLRGRIEYARRALCARCSIPDALGASPKKDWSGAFIFDSATQFFSLCGYTAEYILARFIDCCMARSVAGHINIFAGLFFFQAEADSVSATTAPLPPADWRWAASRLDWHRHTGRYFA